MFTKEFNKYMEKQLIALYYIGNYTVLMLEIQASCDVTLEDNDRRRLKLTKKNLDRMYGELEVFEDTLKDERLHACESVVLPLVIEKCKSIIRNLIRGLDYILRKNPTERNYCLRVECFAERGEEGSRFLEDYLHYLNCCPSSLYRLKYIVRKHYDI